MNLSVEEKENLFNFSCLFCFWSFRDYNFQHKFKLNKRKYNLYQNNYLHFQKYLSNSVLFFRFSLIFNSTNLIKGNYMNKTENLNDFNENNNKAYKLINYFINSNQYNSTSNCENIFSNEDEMNNTISSQIVSIIMDGSLLSICNGTVIMHSDLNSVYSFIIQQSRSLYFEFLNSVRSVNKASDIYNSQEIDEVNMINILFLRRSFSFFRNFIVSNVFLYQINKIFLIRGK